MVSRSRAALAALLLISIAALLPAGIPVGTVVTVTPSNLNGWTPQVSGGATTTFVTGPGTPPLGNGSVQFAVGANGADAAQIRNSTYNGQLLSSITQLSYSTFVQGGGSGGQAPYLILNIDLDNNGTTDDQLFFEPVYQTGTYTGDPVPNQGMVTVGTWQTWNARVGGFWSLNAGTFGPPLVTLDTYIAANPTARLTAPASGAGSLRIVTGFGAGAWDNFVGNADAFSITVGGIQTTFNFEPEPSITINDVTVTEGTGGTTNAVFTVTISTPVSQTVTVQYSTADGTATVADLDYTATSGTATIAPFATTTTITVPINPDTKFEPNETFTVNLTTPANATIADAQGIGTINNDDLVPTISISDVTQAEGTGAGLTNFIFNVTLSNPSSQTITVDFASAPGTAQNTADFFALSGTMQFNPGVTMQTITVGVVADSTQEPDETFFMNLTNAVNATILDNQGVATITNDDGPPAISISDVTAAEGDAGTTNFTFNVTLSNASASTITVNYATADGTATAGSDYTATSGTVTFAPGALIQTVTVAVIGDLALEANETFFVNLTAPTGGATIADAQGAGTITNDDGAADLAITKTASSGVLVTRSSPFSYSISVTNLGPATATNVVVTDVLPAGATFTSATPSQGTCSGTTTVTCNLGTITSGAGATITINVTSPATDQALSNTATVAADQTDTNPANNTSTAVVNVVDSIPTMSEWMLILMAAALAVMGAWVVKR